MGSRTQMVGSRAGRFRLGGNVRLWIDSSRGPIGASGRLLDLSEGGCQLRLHRRVEVQLPGRVNLDLEGRSFWLPVVTRWVREDSHGWTVGCEFDRPTPEKREQLRALLAEIDGA